MDSSRSHASSILRALRVFLERCYTRLVAAVWHVNPWELFDAQYYLSTYPDVAAAGIDPLFHFIRYGAREYRNPNPLFDTGYYLHQHPDVARSGYNPLLHFLRFGSMENRSPHPAFDAAFYLARSPDVAAQRKNPLVHFLKHGAAEGRLPHPNFDRAAYLAAYPDVAAAAMDPVRHFAMYGAAEGRLACFGSESTLALDSFLPVRGPRRRPVPDCEIDVIIPVYKGVRETETCMASVLSSHCAANFRVVAVNDCSPEPGLTRYLRRLSGEGKITLIENTVNVGFVRSVNAAMQASTRDVVLLNSDTRVFDGWLDRLWACAHEADRTGTVTPFSNNATICSYPLFCQDNDAQQFPDFEELDSIFATVNAGRSVEIPTAVGFCMYIRRQCLEDTGLFDADAYGEGYGEENDFCLRATARGWKHKLACDVFVYHAGNVSFGEASARQQTAMRVLLAKHPQYAAIVRSHVEADPAKAYRIAVTAHRIRNSGKRVFLAVTHRLGGGVAQHVDELMERTASTVIWLTLTPASSSASALECLRTEYRFSLILAPSAEHELLAAVVKACGVERIHVHHMGGHAASVGLVVQDLNLPYDFTVHDYYAICPQITLSDVHGKYCGEPDEDGCNRCLERRPAANLMDITSWRAMHSWLFSADRVIAPSVDAAERVGRYFPEARVLAVEHPTPLAPAAVRPRPLEEGECLRVAVLGVMTIHKGLELLEECAVRSARSGSPIEYFLIGSVEGSPHAAAAFSQTGQYQQADLPALLEKVAPHIVWFPARIPETFSYTLSTCLDLGLPAAAHDMGSFRGRLANRPWSWILPAVSSASDWIDFFLSIRKNHFLPAIGPVAPPPQPQAKQGFYPDDYLAGTLAVSRHPRRRAQPRPIRLAAALANNGPDRIQACGYVRVFQPLTHPALADTIHLTVTSAERLATSETDMVLVQRTTVQEVELADEIVHACRRNGSRLLFEIDDDLFHLPVEHPESQAYAGRLEAAMRLARAADAVLVSTETLRRQMQPFNAETIVLPNYLDDRLWRPPSASWQFTSADIRIVYVGTTTHREDLEFLGRAVRKLGPTYRDRIRLDVVGVADGAPGTEWYRTIPVPPQIALSYPRFVEWLLAENRWHWGVAPLLDTGFNRSKSALKFLEYAALGVPSICSDMSAYRDSVRHEETGLLIANDPDSWRDALERAADGSLWKRLRQACPAVVSENTIAANAQTIKAVWRSLAKGEPVDVINGRRSDDGDGPRRFGGACEELQRFPPPSVPRLSSLPRTGNELGRGTYRSHTSPLGTCGPDSQSNSEFMTAAPKFGSWQESGNPRVSMDPAPEALRALTFPPATDAERGFMELRFGDPGVCPHDCERFGASENALRAATRDPWIVWPAAVCGSEFRFFVLAMSCSCEAPQPCGQLFWKGPDRPGFSERLSLRFPVQPDGELHTYILDLHAGANPGVLNHLWWHQGKLDSVRLDPLDAPGEFTIALAGFSHQDMADSVEIREALRLLPLRTELSYRYLRGAGIEIGALQNPLYLRQDTYIRYADRLTAVEARSHYPELDQLALVTPAIICDAAALTPVAGGSADFVIANHVLEHLTDPLSAIQEWLRVVRPGGHAYIAVPDHTNPLDRLRSITPLHHLIADFENRKQQQGLDRTHYREWVASTRPHLSDEQRAAVEAELVSTHYAIHFHTFSRDTFGQLMEQAVRRFSADLLEFRRGFTGEMIEYIAILRKS